MIHLLLLYKGTKTNLSSISDNKKQRVSEYFFLLKHLFILKTLFYWHLLSITCLATNTILYVVSLNSNLFMKQDDHYAPSKLLFQFRELLSNYEFNWLDILKRMDKQNNWYLGSIWFVRYIHFNNVKSKLMFLE